MVSDRLLTFLDTLDVNCDEEITAHTSLIRSDLLDSLALLNLAEWIEQEVGAPIDPTTFDLVEEWDTAAAILSFIDTYPVRNTGRTA